MRDHDPDPTTLNALADRLAALCALPGIAGDERRVAVYMAGDLHASAGHVRIDPVGNLVARYGPAGATQRIAVLAHMDTVGFMVKHIAADGWLRVVAVGGVNVRALPGAAVRLVAHDDPHHPGIDGVISVRSQHQARPNEAPPTLDDIVIQVDPAVVDQITVTQPVVFAPQTVRQGLITNGTLFSSPALDDRAGCAALLELGAWLAEHPPAPDTAIFLVGTAQEETTCLGALHALRQIAPQQAYFVDGTLSYDTPETRDQGSVVLGGGPVLTAYLYASGLNGWHAHPGLRAHLLDHAVAHGIPAQQDAIRGLMSDARAATQLGIPGALIGIPMRGKHGPLETLHLHDLAHACRLLQHALREPWAAADATFTPP